MFLFSVVNVTARALWKGFLVKRVIDAMYCAQPGRVVPTCHLLQIRVSWSHDSFFFEFQEEHRWPIIFHQVLHKIFQNSTGVLIQIWYSESNSKHQKGQRKQHTIFINCISSFNAFLKRWGSARFEVVKISCRLRWDMFTSIGAPV